MACRGAVLEVVGETLDGVDEVGVVGDEASKVIQLLLSLSDGLLVLCCRLRLFCRLHHNSFRSSLMFWRGFSLEFGCSQRWPPACNLSPSRPLSRCTSMALPLLSMTLSSPLIWRGFPLKYELLGERFFFKSTKNIGFL